VPFSGRRLDSDGAAQLLDSDSSGFTRDGASANAIDSRQSMVSFARLVSYCARCLLLRELSSRCMEAAMHFLYDQIRSLPI
jgi:hypothetical protein